jgi:TonB family protein
MMTLRLLLAIILFLGTSAGQSTPELSQEEAVALLSTRVAPVYPALARQARIQGDVVVRLTIDEGGVPTDIRLVSGHPMLSPAVLDAVRQWRFRPYEVDEKAVEADTQITVRFRLGPTEEQRSENRRTEWVNAFEQRTGEHVFTADEEIDAVRILQRRAVKIPGGVSARAAKSDVEVWCIVDAGGNVGDVRVASPGEALMDAAAVEAVRKWRFAPARHRGLPVAQVLTLIVEFQ